MIWLMQAHLFSDITPCYRRRDGQNLSMDNYVRNHYKSTCAVLLQGHISGHLTSQKYVLRESSFSMTRRG